MPSIICCNFPKSHAFPLLSRVSTQPKCFNPSLSFHAQAFPNGFNNKTLESIQRHRFKHFSTGFCQGTKARNFSNGSHQKAMENGRGSRPRNFPCGFSQKGLENCDVTKPRNFSSGFHQTIMQNSHGLKPLNFSNGFHPKPPDNVGIIRARNFSNESHLKATESDRRVRSRKTLPWIASYRNREFKRSEKAPTPKSNHSSWEDSANIYFSKNGTKPSKESSTKPLINNRESRPIDVIPIKTDEGEEEEDVEPVDDPRWDRIKSNYQRIVDRDTRSEKPEVRRWDKQGRWDKQENWGRKTWKEATESTLPKMVGEGVYGVGPVLAALTVGRREFYALYVQEGLDLSSNNRKKKDKKGVEKVLRRAEKIGLTVKEASKHDLNMIVGNRPHQGLVLDASPLEMDSLRELDPVLIEGEKGPVWVALDEVTDPQNLGAIVRSAYFFGAAGVVLCAKNSAPLSGVVSKASAGSLELIELRSCKNMMQFLTNSIENGWRVLGGSVSSRALPLTEVVAGAPTILVLGSEGSGLRPLVEKSCTQLIRIPGNIPLGVPAREIEGEEIEEMDERCSSEEFRSFMAVESLNVSVAAGVLLYHLVGNSKCSLGDKKIDAID
ncbi:uncharacterized protein LOC131222922 [Magnolia sinica]|uniref:uncharacterized protein LOC131222922 n=1 Tax=Magnolia sinica TaxID=86752 RepID=UPI00265ABE19|nr:uncharacterized protein LOC131222922 [Magnolia sinica]